MRVLTKLILLATLLFSVGCAKEKRELPAPATPPPVGPACRACEDPPDRGGDGQLPEAPPGGTDVGGGDTGYDSGSTATLKAPLSSLTQMFYNSVPNSPTNVRINVDLNRIGEEVIVSYMDGGRLFEAAFGSTNPMTGVRNVAYNQWHFHGSTAIWKGFFQDAYGAVVLVIDRSLNTGDGTPAQFLGGSLYFQNFPEVRYPMSPYAPWQGILKTCWEISMGPYDCRTFLVNDRVEMTSSVFPNNKGPNATQPYRKLGDFDGLGRTAAGF